MRLTKIYTRTGDRGSTRLANGEEVPKSSPYVTAYGEVDELSSIIGMILAEKPDALIADRLSKIQHELFDLGGELASAGSIAGLINKDMVKGLENQIDELNQDLPQLEEFILPGGFQTAAGLHFARTVCRRVERSIVALSQIESINEDLIIYVNRLSDLLFVMARYENHQRGAKEIFWQNPRR